MIVHDVRSLARAASAAPAATSKRGNRPFEVLALDLSRLPTNRDLGYQTAALQMKIISKRASTRDGSKMVPFEVESEIPVSSRR
jgi:hypothetical protein